MRRLLTVQTLVLLCSCALCLPLLLPLWTGRLSLLDDLGAFNIPVRYLYREALRRGDSVLWSPAFYSGFYLFGEGQVGMAHPFHWLLYRFPPLHVAVSLEMTSSYLVAMAGGGFSSAWDYRGKRRGSVP